jgi:hypothetical protein
MRGKTNWTSDEFKSSVKKYPRRSSRVCEIRYRLEVEYEDAVVGGVSHEELVAGRIVIDAHRMGCL